MTRFASVELTSINLLSQYIHTNKLMCIIISTPARRKRQVINKYPKSKRTIPEILTDLGYEFWWRLSRHGKRFCVKGAQSVVQAQFKIGNLRIINTKYLYTNWTYSLSNKSFHSIILFTFSKRKKIYMIYTVHTNVCMNSKVI